MESLIVPPTAPTPNACQVFDVPLVRPLAIVVLDRDESITVLLAVERRCPWPLVTVREATSVSP